MRKFILSILLPLLIGSQAFAALVVNPVTGKLDKTGSGGGSIPSTFSVCATDTNVKTGCNYTADGTNDEVQIQAAINAAAALTYGGTVLLREGHYSISSSIVPKSKVWLKGYGRSQTVLVGENGLANTSVIQDSTTFSPASPLTNFSVTDLTIDGTNMSRTGYSPSRKGIFIQYLSKAIFRNLYIYNTPATCLGADYLYDGLIDNNIVDTCGTAGQAYNVGSNGIGVGILGANSYNDEPLIITNNIAKNVANKGIMVEAQDSAVSPRHTIISNNISYNSKDGFSIAGGLFVNFTGNQSFGNSQDGLWVDGTARSGSALPWSSLIISGNNVNGNAGDGIEIKDEASSNLVVTDNIIHNNTGVGLKLKPQHSIVSNNVISSNGLDGIWFNIGVAGKNMKITNNIIRNNGTLSTAGSNNGIKVNVTTVNWDYLEISGNTIVDTQGSPTQDYGILIDMITGGTLTNAIIRDNHIRGNVTGAINNVDVPAGNIVQFGNWLTSGGIPFVVAPPAAQTIAAGNTISADGCGTIKQITASGAVTTSTTNTFTAPALNNSGCIMSVCNVGANNITLDNNANFKSFGGSDIVMTADDCVKVVSTGSGGAWYQLTPLEAN